jgi:hypothetical protein
MAEAHRLRKHRKGGPVQPQNSRSGVALQKGTRRFFAFTHEPHTQLEYAVHHMSTAALGLTVPGAQGTAMWVQYSSV